MKLRNTTGSSIVQIGKECLKAKIGLDRQLQGRAGMEAFSRRVSPEEQL